MGTGRRKAKALFTWVLSAALCAGVHGATTLDLSFVDTDGKPVRLATADLLLVAWGATERIGLETSDDGLSLTLDGDWLRSRWSRFDDQEGVYLYLQAPPLAAIQSHRFTWLGAAGHAGAVTIAFPRGQEIAVDEGMNATMTVVFRTTARRRVRVVDPDGRPRPGTAINAFMFWSQSNHCAVLAGGEPLGSFVANTDGWIEVPDGDFEYAFELGRGFTSDHVFLNEGRYERERLVTRLLQPDTDVVVHQFPVRPLEMRVWRADEPAPGISLHAHMANCPCGACSGPLAQTDETGRIRLDEFRPEEWAWVWLVDGDTEYWRTAPTAWSSGNVEVKLSPANGTAQASFSR